MKNLSFLAILLFFGTHFLQAQDYYLPVSSKSETAKAAYYKAMEAMEHAKFGIYAEQIKQALREDPDFLMAYGHRALGFSCFKEYEQAKELARKALEIPTGAFTPAEHVMFKMLVLLEKQPEADPMYLLDELVMLYPENPQAYELRSLAAYWISGDLKKALADNKKLAKLNPTYTGAYNMLGYNYMAAGKMKKAKKAFKKYISLAPDEANPYDSMGDYYFTAKDFAKSAEYYDKAAAMGMLDAVERARKARSMMLSSSNSN